MASCLKLRKIAAEGQCHYWRSTKFALSRLQIKGPGGLVNLDYVPVGKDKSLRAEGVDGVQALEREFHQ
jgi:hypothetical protein